MTHLRLIADDLTGALDSAAQFTGALGPLPVILNPALAPLAGSFVLDLACRDLPQAEAVARTASTAHHFEGADIAFKKIDSLLRGHWASEVAVLARRGWFRRIILAPAFPAQGRVTEGGRQVIRHTDGTSTIVPVDGRAELAALGLDVSTLSAGGRLADASLLLCDAGSDGDLRHLVASVRPLPGPTLWCGSAGLGLALSGGRQPPSVKPAEGPHLMVVGSDHAVTRDQVRLVDQHAPEAIVTFSQDGVVSAERINRSLGLHGKCLCLADLPQNCSRTDAADLLARWFRAMAPRIAQPTTLTVVGGETFASICRALEVDMLLVEGEWQAGVPASRSTPGLWPKMACFSKSGAFGEPDCLLRLLGSG